MTDNKDDLRQRLDEAIYKYMEEEGLGPEGWAIYGPGILEHYALDLLQQLQTVKAYRSAEDDLALVREAFAAMTKRAEEAEAHRAMLHEKLESYGGHPEFCNSHNGPWERPEPCDCELGRALSATAPSVQAWLEERDAKIRAAGLRDEGEP